MALSFRIPAKKPQQAVCPACRRLLTETRYLWRWCDRAHYAMWVEAERERELMTEFEGIPESDVYKEPQCERCFYWFKTEESLAHHLKEDHRHATA